MADDDDLIDPDDDLDDDPEQQPQNTPANLRRAAREGTKAKADAASARKELEFVKAGVDTDTDLGKLLFNGYTGEVTKDAIQAAARAVGALPPAGEPAGDPPAPDPISADERKATSERQTLASGAAGDTGIKPPDEDPATAARKAHESAMTKGAGREHAMASAAAAIRAKAEAGDARAIYDGPAASLEG